MASDYPAALDALATDYEGTDQADVVDHAGMHNDVNAAINAVQAELGLDPAGSAATVKARLDAVDADTRWTNPRTPTAHKTSHATGGADALTAADIGAATAAQGSKADTAVQPARAITAGTGLSGGGDLSTDRTIAVAAGGIGTTQLATDAVTADKIAADAVGSSEIAANAVGSSELADGAVTVVKLTGAYGAKTSAYTLTTADSVIAADTTSGAFALTLPAASACTGKALSIIKTAGANVLTVQRAGSDTILPSSGTRTSVAFPSDCAMGEILLVSSGSAWHVVSGQASDETVGSRLYKWSQAKAGTSTTAAVGWRLVHYDSGWRRIAQWDASGVFTALASGMLYDGFGHANVTFNGAGDMAIRRTVDELQAFVGGMKTTAATGGGSMVFAAGGSTAVSLPTGFATTGNMTQTLAPASTLDPSTTFAIGFAFSSDRFSAVSGTGTKTQSRSLVKFPTTATLPSSLPGVAVSI